MLHTKKSESIVQWYNSLTTKGNVNSLEQFTDGSYFSRIIAILRGGSKEDNLTTESVIFSETSIACNEEVITSVEEQQEADGKMETTVSESVKADPFVIKESDLTDTQKTYDDIRKFIDDFYHLESSSLIDYGECMKGKELELAKVAVFLLSAMVQTFLSSENELVYNTTLLEMEVQENIHECLTLVLHQQENQIKKVELHKVLSRAAIHKGTPVRKSSRSTSDPNDASEGVKNVFKKRKERQSVIVYEDLQNSPLKSLLESPKIQYKAALMKKESELKKLRSALHDEENKVIELTSEKQNLNDELKKKKKDLAFYKKELESQREALCEKEEQEKLKDEELKVKKNEAERSKKLVERQDEEIKQLNKNYEALQKKLEDKQQPDTATSFVKENNELKDKIQFLDIDNHAKDEKIKTLEARIESIQNELQKAQEFCASNRKELRSSSVSDPLSTIIYADEQSREKSERKDQEVKCISTSEDISVPGSASIPKILNSIKKESNVIESSTVEGSANMCDDLQHLPLNSGRIQEMRLGFTRYALNIIISQLSCKNFITPILENVLLENCSKMDDPDALVVLLRDLLISLKPPHQVATDDSKKSSTDDSKKSSTDDSKKSSTDDSKKSSTDDSKRSSVATRSRSQASEEKKDANSFTNTKINENPSKVKNERRTKNDPDSLRNECYRMLHENAELNIENNALKRELHKSQKLVENLQKDYENSSKEVEDLKQEVTSLKDKIMELEQIISNMKQEVVFAQDKYINMEKLAKKKDDDVKKALIMYQRIVKLDKKEKESKKECGEDCEKLRRRCKQLNEVCVDFEQEASELKSTIKHLEGMMEHLQFEIKELKKEKKELQHNLWKETAALSRNTTDRDALVLHYLKKSKHEPKKIKDLELEREEKKSSRPIVKVDAYILNSDNEPSMSNSVLPSRSIRSGYFQVADEDDFLNESSLAEIHNGGIPEGESGENRLLELQRRNTLCPPHLQSSYPLEIQNMTPSERKYYNPGEVSFDLSMKRSQNQGKRDIHNKPKSTYMESDSDEADDSHSFPVKKRKISEADRISVPASKKQYRPSSSVGKRPSKDQGILRKPSTPLKRVAAFVKRQSNTFITPSSVNRLMKLQRKNKIH